MTATVSELDGNGDCYETAIHYAQAHTDRELRICHGEPLGQGPIEGIRHGHAWVEETRELFGFPLTFVTDVSNGKTIEGMPAAFYYMLGRIDETEVRRYDLATAHREMRRTRHYGPWVEQGQEERS